MTVSRPAGRCQVSTDVNASERVPPRGDPPGEPPIATLTEPGVPGSSAYSLAAARAAAMEASAFFFAALLLTFCRQQHTCVKKI